MPDRGKRFLLKIDDSLRDITSHQGIRDGRESRDPRLVHLRTTMPQPEPAPTTGSPRGSSHPSTFPRSTGPLDHP